VLIIFVSVFVATAPQRAWTCSINMFADHTHRRPTFGRNPPDWWSDRPEASIWHFAERFRQSNHHINVWGVILTGWILRMLLSVISTSLARVIEISDWQSETVHSALQ